MPRDHPRVCGEQVNVLPLIQTITGSSPRVRGADIKRIIFNRQRGIIPACAGSSSLHVLPWAGARDHPRVCGEQSLNCVEIVNVKGSSPRVRGAGKQSKSGLTYSGIIPACAGSRAVPRRPARGQRDHPRVCGEQCISG